MNRQCMFLGHLPFSYEDLAEEFVILKRKHSSSFLREYLSRACDCLKLNIFDRYSLSQEVPLKPFRRGGTYQDKSPVNPWLNAETPVLCSKLTQESIEIFHWAWRLGYGCTSCLTKLVNKLVHYFFFFQMLRHSCQIKPCITLGKAIPSI